MKKFTIIFIIMALVLSLSVPVLAAYNGEKIEVSLIREADAPKYYVSIPETIELKWNQSVSLPVTAEGVANLNGMKIVVGIEDAKNGKWSLAAGHPINDFDDFLIVENSEATGDYYKTIVYTISNGPASAARKGSLSDIFLEFTEEGSQEFRFITGGGIVSAIPEQNREYDLDLIYPNSEYQGLIIFGIKLEW